MESVSSVICSGNLCNNIARIRFCEIKLNKSNMF